MATITKRGNTYRIKVSLGYDLNGKQIVKSTTFKPPEKVTEGKAKKLAQTFAFEFEQQCRGMTSLNENMRFSELANWYFENYAPNELKPITIYNYRSQLNNHIMPVIGHLKLKDISTPKITAMFKDMDLSSATIRKIYIILQSVFTRGVEQGFIKETPCKNVILPKNRKTNPKKPTLDEQQIYDFLKLFESYSPFNTIIKVLLYTGMRSGECLGLQWEDIDFENHTIHIRHNLTDVGGKHWLTTPKTESSIRDIGMSEILSDILKEHKEHQENLINAMGKSFAHPEMVFTSELGNYKDRSSLNTSFRRFLKETPYEFLTLHSLRHQNATLLLNAGVDIKIVSEHLGHSGVEVTANVYADVLKSTKSKVADLISLTLNKQN